MPISVLGQDQISDYKWKNRILILIDHTENKTTLTEQLKLLGSLNSEFDERKLLVFEVNKNGFQILNDPTTELNRDNSIHKNYNSEAVDSKVILIGLDGYIKMEQSRPITRDQLFSIIDGMPMRRAERQIKN